MGDRVKIPITRGYKQLNQLIAIDTDTGVAQVVGLMAVNFTTGGASWTDELEAEARTAGTSDEKLNSFEGDAKLNPFELGSGLRRRVYASRTKPAHAGRKMTVSCGRNRTLKISKQ